MTPALYHHTLRARVLSMFKLKSFLVKYTCMYVHVIAYCATIQGCIIISTAISKTCLNLLLCVCVCIQTLWNLISSFFWFLHVYIHPFFKFLETYTLLHAMPMQMSDWTILTQSLCTLAIGYVLAIYHMVKVEEWCNTTLNVLDVVWPQICFDLVISTTL